MGHIPSRCLGHPLIPVNGATPSLIMMRIWGSGRYEHSSTECDMSTPGRYMSVVENLRWNCTLVANGANWETLNERSFGMCVSGRGPVAANEVKLSAVMTLKGGQSYECIVLPRYTLFRTTTSWVAST